MIAFVRGTFLYFLFHWEDCGHDEELFAMFLFAVFLRMRWARLI